MRNLSAGQHRHSIDLSGLGNGTYIVTMESADVTMSVKMMVVK